MATSSRLPDPEKYRAALDRKAERVRRAQAERDRPVKEIGENVRFVLSGLNGLDETLGGNFDELSSIVEDRFNSVPKIKEIREEFKPILDGLGALMGKVEAMSHAIDAIPAPERAEVNVDLSSIDRRLDSLAMQSPEIVKVAEPMMPSSLSMKVTGRDANGDIETVSVEATRH